MDGGLDGRCIGASLAQLEHIEIHGDDDGNGLNGALMVRGK